MVTSLDPGWTIIKKSRAVRKHVKPEMPEAKKCSVSLDRPGATAV